MFSFSRIFYIAAVLPMPQNFIKRVDMSVGKFLWNLSGKLLRVSLQDIKLPKSRGGLGLICLSSMAKSLRLSQLLRLLKSGDDKSVSHIWFWIGSLLEDLIPDRGQAELINIVPKYYESLAEILADAKISGTVSSLNWRFLTNKLIYKSLEDTFPKCKIEQVASHALTDSWQKILLPCLASSTREVLYLIIHNKLPTQERLFRVGMINDPYCQSCLPIIGAVQGDREHVFCNCLRVQEVWNILKSLIIKRLPASFSGSNLDIITLNFPKQKDDAEVVWLMGRYLEESWRLVKGNEGNRLSKRKFFGFLKFKYRVDQLGAKMPLDISELNNLV